MPGVGAAGKGEVEIDRLSVIIEQFNELFGGTGLPESVVGIAGIRSCFGSSRITRTSNGGWRGVVFEVAYEGVGADRVDAGGAI